MPWESARKDPAYGQAAWKRARNKAMRDANWRCELRLEGCQGSASEVDHIMGLAADPQHKQLRAVCKSCHRKRTAEQGNSAKRRAIADPPFVPRTQW